MKLILSDYMSDELFLSARASSARSFITLSLLLMSLNALSLLNLARDHAPVVKHIGCAVADRVGADLISFPTRHPT